MTNNYLPSDISSIVSLALSEDIGDGDITSALIPKELEVRANIICRENAILCGIPWVKEAYEKIDNTLQIKWGFRDGDGIKFGDKIADITGNARAILSGERTVLNFLQTLSGTATTTAEYLVALKGTSTRLLDTRKTLPGLRAAQKYAVKLAGGHNHRAGLYDAYLIKENHIKSCGSVSTAVTEARKMNPRKAIEVEVQNLDEFKEALSLKPEIIMLDNFELADIEKAVAISSNTVKLEVSGGIDLESLAKIAKAGIDYISVGALTKHCRAVDFSLLLE